MQGHLRGRYDLGEESSNLESQGRGGSVGGAGGEAGGSVGGGGLASGVTNIAGQSGGAAATSASASLGGAGGSGSEIGASIGGGSDSASADISAAGAAALSDATGGSMSASLGGSSGGSIGGGGRLGAGGKASGQGSSAGGSTLGAGAEAGGRMGGDLATGASAGITAGASADVGGAGGATGLSDQNACGSGYPGVKYCYTFDSVVSVRGEPTVIEAMGSSKNAVLKRGAFLDDSGSITFLSLVGKPRSYVQLGNFIGECTSDPETCTSGLTVSFWLKIQTKDIDGNSEAHQYIISSGGQVGSARGFSFLYVKEESKFKLQLQTRSSVYMIELDSVPEKWFHFCFTYSADSGLTYYQDGVQRKASDPKSKEFEFDGHTNLTVGRPNHIDKHFGSFRMDQLAIFYKLLKPDGVKNIGRVASDVGVSSTAVPPVDGSQTTAGPTRAVTQAPPLVTQPGSKPDLIPPTGKGGACQAKADIVLILDNSGSIEGRGHEGFFRKIIGFAKQFYRAFDVPTSADVAIVEASTDAHLVFNFGEMKDIESMDAAVDALIAKKQRSFIGRALELTRTQVLGPVMCNNKAKLVVVVTDGYTSDDVMLPSLEMRDSGVIILTVAFGEETPFVRYTTKLMASDPKSEHIFMLGYDELLQSVPDIASVACKDASEATAPDNVMSDATKNVVGGVSLGFKILFLDEVNRYRHMHSAVPVMWSAELTIQAQRWAEYLASQEKLQHMPKVKFGQAMYISTKPGPISAQISVRAWYNQIMFYDFQKPAISTYNSYFVQMVWRSSTQVGVGKFTSPTNKTYVVAFFSPGALDDEILKYNVLPVTGSAVHGISIGYCPEGYQANGGYCYKLYSEPMSWVEAVATCNAQKSSLVSIARDEEYYFVTNMMHESTVTQIWIGLNDRVNEGSFTWVDGMPLSFNGWLSPPQIGGERDCVQFNVDKGWLDAVCNVRQAFICKTLMPGDVIFMVTIHYPAQPWSNELSYGTSAAATELMQRVERLVMDVYGTKEWFLSYNIKAFRGQVSVYIDMELRFAPTAPIDPLQPLKDVAYTESCEGFICDLSDIQLVPAINVTYNGTCTPSCYSTCTPTCDPGCCSPPSAPPLYAYPPPSQITQIEPPGQAPLVVAAAVPMPPIPPPMPAPAPPPLPPMPAINTDSFCLPICATRCVAACPKMCCSDLQKRNIRNP